MRTDTHTPSFGTFGTFRWVLAVIVFISHLFHEHYEQLGWYAVFGFFTLSGYIAAYILKTHYFHVRFGILKYYLNRLLRVFPLYWVALAAMTWLMYNYRDLSPYMQQFLLPVSFASWLANIGIFGLTNVEGDMRHDIILLVGWSLQSELLWWLLIPVFIYQTVYPRALLILAVVYTLAILAFSLANHQVNMLSALYFSPIAAVLPYSVGLLLYYRKTKGWPDFPLPGVSAFFLFLLGFYCFHHQQGLHPTFLAQVAIIYFLSGIDIRKLPRWFMHMDRFLGELSYPVFLFHIPIIVSVNILFPDLSHHDVWIFLLTFTILHLVAVLSLYAIEKPVQRLRERVRC